MVDVELGSAAGKCLIHMVRSYKRLISIKIDFRASNAQLSQGNQLALQAGIVEDNMALLEKEWKEYWE